MAGKSIVWFPFAVATTAVTAVGKYETSPAFAARMEMFPLLAVAERFVPPVIVPGPASTANVNAPVPDPPVAESPLVAPYASGVAGANTRGACSRIRYSNAFEATDCPRLVDTTTTWPVPAATAAPAVTTICVEPFTAVTVAVAPHTVTLATSPMVPLHRFVPDIVTGNPPPAEPVDGSTPLPSVPGAHFAMYHEFVPVPSACVATRKNPPAYSAPSTGSVVKARTESLTPCPMGFHRCAAASQRAIRSTRTLGAFVSAPSESYVLVKLPPA